MADFETIKLEIGLKFEHDNVGERINFSEGSYIKHNKDTQAIRVWGGSFTIEFVNSNYLFLSSCSLLHSIYEFDLSFQGQILQFST